MQLLPTQRARWFGLAARLAAAPLALALAFGPAAALAGESKANLRVTATVLPACQVSSAAVQCSSGEAWIEASSARSTARPLAQAESLLGEPVLREALLYAGVPQPAAPPSSQPAAGGASYLTITY